MQLQLNTAALHAACIPYLACAAKLTLPALVQVGMLMKQKVYPDQCGAICAISPCSNQMGEIVIYQQ
jgi:hypothetical protein